MVVGEKVRRRDEAASAFDQHERRNDGAVVVRSLSDGLTVLRDLAFRRVHYDVESAFGVDSMLMPVSAVKSELQAKIEIEIYQVAEAVVAAAEHNYVRDDGDWFRNWLTGWRLADFDDLKHRDRRLNGYLVRTADERRLSFGDIMSEVFPESRRAPLVLFRLLPHAVHIAAALAFGDHFTASELRNRQCFHLPAIEDCQECHGGLLDNGERCSRCGNPLWKYEWLTSAD
jgi:hypothetical protein